MSATNGKLVEGSRTQGYRPAIANYLAWAFDDDEGRFSRFDIEWMDQDPQVIIAYAIKCAPIYAATCAVESNKPEVKEFVARTVRRFWKRDLHKALMMLKSGTAGGEAVYRFDRESKLWEWDYFKDIHVNDLRALEWSGKFWGVKVMNLPGSNGVKLRQPAAMWFTMNAQYGQFYGIGVYQGMWKPWKEKTGRHGAIPSRRTWFMKNSFQGPIIRYPEGSIEIEPGVFKSNQDIAREIVEKSMAGCVQAFPGAFDPETGKFLWDYIEPKVNGDGQFLLEYIKCVDEEIIVGSGTPPEVYKAAATGSGWAGRSLPFLVFLTGEDRIVDSIIEPFDRLAIRHLVHVNFGASADYEIKPNSLVPKDMAENAPPGGQPGQATQAQGQPTPQEAAPQLSKISMSVEQQTARRVADFIIERGKAAA